jgi:methyl-accepting chemotaxis protein
MNQTRRKIKLIDRDFQFRLIVKFIIINTLVLALFGALIYIFFNSEISSNFASAHVTYKNISQMLLPIVLTLSVINLLVTSIIIFVVVLYASHKIAGPMYRFNAAVGEITARNLHPLTKIREKDQLRGLSDSLAQMAETLAADFTEIKNKISEAKTLLPKENTPPELREKLEDVEAIINKYNL